MAKYVAPKRDHSRPFEIDDRYLRRAERHAEAAIERAQKLASEIDHDGEVSSCPHLALVAIREWLIDSGSAFHLLGEQDISEQEAETQCTADSPESLQTASGLKSADQVASFKVPALKVSSQALLLDNAPPVLSLGKLVLGEGCSFMWKAGGGPCADD